MNRQLILAAVCAALLLASELALPVTLVGRTVGAPSVSSDGEGSYTVPLAIPPGRAGLQPSLALVYSHRSGNGIVGMGWSLSGLSRITRCGSTIAQDGTAGAVTLTSLDRFCLDGNRLRLRPDSPNGYGGMGSTYRTEIEQFSLVTITGWSGGTPTQFEVKRKDGLIYEYGYTADSRIESLALGAPVRVWAVNKIKDRVGNDIRFEYNENTANAGGSFRPKKISYTEFNGSAPSHMIEFVYENRVALGEDPIVSYVGGGQIREINRLSRIDIEFGTNNVVRKYQLGYEALGGLTPKRSRLETLTECGAVDCYPATTFTYSSGATGWGGYISGGVASGAATITTMAYTLAGDMTGDGLEDIAYFDTTLDAWQVLAATNAVTAGDFNLVNTGKGSGAYYQQALPIDLDGDGKRDVLVPDTNGNWWWLHRNASGTWLFTDTLRAATGAGGNAWTIDVNGDGREDLVWVSGNQLRWRRNIGGSFEANDTLAWTITSGGNFASLPFGTISQMYRRVYRVADFNGDGRGDLVIGLSAQPSSWSVLTSGESCADVFPCQNGGCCAPDLCSSNPPTGQCVVADQCNTVLGDALTQWRCGASSGSGFQVLYGTDTGFSSSGAQYIASATSEVNVADFNGDGLSDLYYYFGGSWSILFSEGGNNEFTAAVSTGPTLYGDFMASDWDSDGKEDLLVANGNWQVLRSTGETLLAPTDTLIPATGSAGVKVLDIDGKGLPDLFYLNNSNLAHRRLHSGSAPDLLDTVRDAFVGNTYADVNFDYVSLTDSMVYTKLSGAAFPSQDYQGPLKVVKQYTASDGRGNFYTMSYKYEGMRIDLQGRGSLGIAQRTVTDTRANNYTVETYEQNTAGDNWERIGAMLSSTTRTNPAAVYPAPADAKVREVTNQWARIAYGSGSEVSRFPYLFIATVKNYEINTVNSVVNPLVSTVTTTVTNMGTYGTALDMTVVTKEEGTGNNAGMTKTERVFHVSLLNELSESVWCFGRPQTTQITNSHQLTSGGEVTRTIGHDWDATNCRLNWEALEPGDPDLELKTAYAYDSYGNIDLLTVTQATNSGQPARVTDPTWDGSGRFPLTIKNPLNQVTTLDWDQGLGWLNSRKDANLLTTSWSYDQLGRLLKETRPDGTSTQRDFFSCTGTNPDPDCAIVTNAEYKVRTQLLKSDSTVLAESFTIHDDFDRVRRASRYQLGGGVSDVLTEYRKIGLLWLQSQPHFTGYPYVWTSQTYDALGRLTRSSRAKSNDGDATAAATDIAYAGLKTTVTDPNGKVTTQIAAAWGTVAQVLDANSVDMDYEFDAFDNLTKTRDASNNEITALYNKRGFKTSSSDPDMGGWQYTYFPTGDLHTQTDAKSVTMTLAVDKLSRPTSRIEPEGTTTWHWGTSSTLRNIGQLEYVTSPGGYREDHYFDALGRPSSMTTTAGGTYTVSYSYNATTGFLETLTYPSSSGANPLKLKYEYETANKSGVLKAVKDYTGDVLGTAYWQATSTDAFGQYLDTTLGNDLTSLVDFDSITGAVNGITSPAGTGTVQDLSYVHDKVGNLIDRVDLNQSSLTEHFVLDNLYRVTSSTVNGSNNLTVAYDTPGLGNIASYDTDQITPKTYVYTGVQNGCSYYNYAQPHAVRKVSNTVSTTVYCYDANGNMVKRGNDAIAWYSYNLPSTIAMGSNSSQLYYGAQRQRYKQVSTNAGAIETTIYIAGLFEKVTETGQPTEYKHSIQVAGRTVALHTRYNSGSPATFYLLPDHLGSVDKITNSAGGVQVPLSYEAFGKRRDDDWVGDPSSSEWTQINATTHRGYTEHEHLDSVALVHMNGRVYDPGIGRFLSADPFVTEPFNGQSFNRYSYVNNHPLSFTDPSGFLELHNEPSVPAPSDDDNSNPNCVSVAFLTACVGQIDKWLNFEYYDVWFWGQQRATQEWYYASVVEPRLNQRIINHGSGAVATDFMSGPAGVVATSAQTNPLFIAALGASQSVRPTVAARIVVDLGENTLAVEDKGGNTIFGECAIVHGCEAFDTPTGEFRAGGWQGDKTNPKYGPVPWSKDHANPYGPWFLPIFDQAGRYTTYGIHGTAGPAWSPFVKPPFASLWGDFAGCSHGCIRLSNPSIEALHDLIPDPVGLPILIIGPD